MWYASVCSLATSPVLGSRMRRGPLFPTTPQLVFKTKAPVSSCFRRQKLIKKNLDNSITVAAPISKPERPKPRLGLGFGWSARMLDLQKRRVQLALFVAGLIALSMTAEKFRELVGKGAASKSGEFTFLNCFDMGSGTLACGAKEGIKLYVYNLRSAHVEKMRQRATEAALTDALKEGLSAGDAAKQAQKVGAKAAKLASRQAKRILGPIISSGWDFFEAIYFEGTMTEGFLRGTGTLFGTYAGGFHGEQRLGRLGYLMGSHLGSWVGGRIGLMVYDIVNGVNYLLQFVQPEENTSSVFSDEDSDSKDTYKTEEHIHYESPSGETGYYETPQGETEEAEASGGWGIF